jgi:hypothetical protein
VTNKQRRLRPGQETAARRAASLGSRDPRARRNDEAGLTDLGMDPPLVQSNRNRLTISLDENYLTVDTAGRLTLSDAAKAALGL